MKAPDKKIIHLYNARTEKEFIIRAEKIIEKYDYDNNDIYYHALELGLTEVIT